MSNGYTIDRNVDGSVTVTRNVGDHAGASIIIGAANVGWCVELPKLTVVKGKS